MDLLKSDIKKVYFKYLAAAFGGTLISSIYSTVDMAVVGQYQGPNGSAALAVVAPIWNIIFSLGMLTGIGGSILYSTAKGQGGDGKKENEYFTIALGGTFVLAALCWAAVVFFQEPMLRMFGASDEILPIAKNYIKPILFIIPLFLITQMLSAFLRNDNSPTLTTIATLSGGIFNIFGDYFFVFGLDLGAFGAGLATAFGAVITFSVTLLHFFSKRNTLKIVKVENVFTKLENIVALGFSSFFIDVAMGVMTTLFNRQIMKYLGTDALAVYGVIVNVSTLAQCCAYSIGNAAQPIISINFGAKQYDRIKKIVKYSLGTCAVFAAVWTGMCMLAPQTIIKVFMTPTQRVLDIAPKIIRTYTISFMMLPFNIFSTYYFQSVMKAKLSFLVSVLRGAIISGSLVMLLPVTMGINSIWLAMPITEAIILCFVIRNMSKHMKTVLV